jgi:topoisomerase-4 subunit A
MLASIGENRKMPVFKLEEVNEMTRGKGVILQRFAEGGLSDLRAFVAKEGLSWIDAAGRTFSLPRAEYREWEGARSQAGKLAPKGFPRSNKSGPAFG